MAKKIVITGASGLLGRVFLAEFRKCAGCETRGTALRRVAAGLDHLDLTDAGAVRRYLARTRPHIIIHAAAERRPDVSERNHDATFKLNVEATRELARGASELGAWLIYMSSDYVFDGTNPPYAPDAPTNPLNFYGRSKRDGEIAIAESTVDYCILRVPLLYGMVEYMDESPVTVLAKSVFQSKDRELTLDDWAIRYPTHVEDVAVACRQIVEHKSFHPEFGGIVHWSGSEPMTRYTMGVACARVAGLPVDNIVPSKTPLQGAPRPRNSHLDSSALERLGIGRRTEFQTGLEQVLKPWLPA